MSLVALIPAEGKISMSWLGGMTLLERAIRKLEDIREIDQVLVLVHQDDDHAKAIRAKVEQYQPKFDPEQLRVFEYTGPTPCRLFGVPDVIRVAQAHNLPSGCLADCWVVLNPRFPFIGSEVVSDIVARAQTVSLVTTVHNSLMLHCQGSGCLVTPGSNVVDACTAVWRTWWEAQEWEKLKESSPFENEHSGISFGADCYRVRVLPLECVDVSHPDGLAMANAMVSYG